MSISNINTKINDEQSLLDSNNNTVEISEDTLENKLQSKVKQPK